MGNFKWLEKRNSDLVKEVELLRKRKFSPTIMAISRELYEKYGFKSPLIFQQTYYRVRKEIK